VDKDQSPNTEQRATPGPLEERGVVTDILIGAGGNLAADAVKAGAGKLAGKVKKDKALGGGPTPRDESDKR
jgi:hypothetical protein